MNSIGFAILTHNRPEQLLRLVRTLDAMFTAPPIVVHHDFGNCPLVASDFPPHVRFVRDYVSTTWGEWSLVEGTLRAVRDLFGGGSAARPDWFALLSGADYPVAPADRILTELTSSNADAFLQFQPVAAPGADATQRQYVDRYLRRVERLRCPCRDLKWRRKSVGLPAQWSGRFLPFGPGMNCYAGSQWFTASAKAADRLLDLHREGPLLRHYRKVRVPDESYIHCLLANQPDLYILPDNKRFIRHSPGDASPRNLTVDDLPAILNSGAHFARKFAPDDVVLDRLDELLRPTAICNDQRA